MPLLPCRSIDEIVAFYAVLGFATTYRQVKLNPYVALKREDLELHFFGMPDFDPADSYGSCMVIVPDTGVLFEAFAAGMRAAQRTAPRSPTPWPPSTTSRRSSAAPEHDRNGL